MNRLIEAIWNRRATGYATSIILTVVIGLVLLAWFPVPVQAQPDLVVEGEGATSWAIGGIMPGDSGTKTVTLSNIGDADGQVFIWISDIVSSEGVQPESETGNTGEPGELLGNLLFSISSDDPGFSTDLVLPTTLDNFPNAAESTPYIIVDPLDAGDEATITWNWELPFETGNEVQGDLLSFAINYSLVEFPPPYNPPPYNPPPLPPEREPFVPPQPPPPPPPSLPEPVGSVAEIRFCPDDVFVYADPGQCFASKVDLGTPTIDRLEGVVAITNDAPSIFPVGETIVTWTTTDIHGNRVTCTQTVTVLEGEERYIEIDMLGRVSKVRLTCPDCTVAETSVVSDPSDVHFLTIEGGTHVLCRASAEGGSCPELIVMSLSDEKLPVPKGMALVSPVYEFTGYQERDSRYPICSQVDFDRPVTMLLSYDPGELPQDASSPFIAYWDSEHGDWVKLEYTTTGSVAETGEFGEVDGITQHLSLFAVMVEVPTNRYLLPTNLPTVSGVDWWIIVAIVGGSVLALGLILFHRRQRRKILTKGN
jgi:hypothetical protein